MIVRKSQTVEDTETDNIKKKKEEESSLLLFYMPVCILYAVCMHPQLHTFSCSQPYGHAYSRFCMHCMQSIPELGLRIECIVGFLMHTMHTSCDHNGPRLFGQHGWSPGEKTDGRNARKKQTTQLIGNRRLGRIRLFRLVDQRTARQHHEADDFTADQNNGEHQADIVEHGAAERAVALALLQVGALHLREHACGMGRRGRADGCQTDEYQNPQHESRLCTGRMGSASNAFPRKKGIMDAKDLRKKADGLADIAVQMDRWLSDVPDSLSDWFEAAYGTDVNELSRLWEVAQDMRDVAKRHIRLECENRDCWNANPLPGADHQCRTCGMWHAMSVGRRATGAVTACAPTACANAAHAVRWYANNASCRTRDAYPAIVDA